MNRDNKKLRRITAELAGAIAGLCEDADKAMAKMERLTTTTEEYRQGAGYLCMSAFAGSYLGHILHECATRDIEMVEGFIRFHVEQLKSKGCHGSGAVVAALDIIHEKLADIVNRYFEKDEA